MINERIFGSDLPIKVKQVLEARQLAASRTRHPNDEVASKRYKKYDNENYWEFGELINNDFNGVADLSSRTPFARMWTAVELVTPEQAIENLAVFEVAPNSTTNQEYIEKEKLVAEGKANNLA